MKARDFRYFRARTLPEAVKALQMEGPDAVVLSGGQSLLPALNMRLSAPSLLVDIGDLVELQGMEMSDGMLRIGAATTHADVISSPFVQGSLPLLRRVGEHIAHVGVRNRGTIGGSLANADPAAEWPATMVALGARFLLVGPGGERVVPAEAFFKGLLETDLQPGEILVRIDVPLPGPGVVTAFDELTRRHGDFAIAGVVACARLEGARLVELRIVYLGCADYARPAAQVMQALVGASLPLVDDSLYGRALKADLQLGDTPGMRADTRLKLANALTRRVINSLARPA